MNPPVITYDELDRTVECDGMGNPHDINAWVNSFSCADDTTTNPHFSISPNPIEFTGDSCDRIAYVNSATLPPVFRVELVLAGDVHTKRCHCVFLS